MDEIIGAMYNALKAVFKLLKKLAIILCSVSLPLFCVIMIGTVITIVVANESNSSSSNDKTVSMTEEEDAGDGTAQDTINFAKQYVGKNLQYFLKNDNSGRFFGNHWCAMFCGYVLYNTNKESLANRAYSASCSMWNNSLSKVDNLHLKGSNYEPKAGDLVFFGDGGSEHIGLIASSDKETKKITTIEGNSGQGPYPWGSVVTYGNTYNWSDSWVYGFGEVDYKEKSNSDNSNDIDEKTKNFKYHLEYTGTETKLSADEIDVLKRSVYREAGGEGFECQVYVCSATLNLWDSSYSSWSLSKMVHTYNIFESGPTIDSVTDNEKKYVEDAVDFVLNGGRVKDIKYFQMGAYHNFGNGNPTPVCNVDNTYFSK